MSMDPKKRKGQRAESRTEGNIQYFTLATLFNGCSTSCVLCFVYVNMQVASSFRVGKAWYMICVYEADSLCYRSQRP